jgi:hypothetical protein
MKDLLSLGIPDILDKPVASTKLPPSAALLLAQ